MTDAAQWFRLVLAIGAGQALFVGVSLAWLLARSPGSPPEAPSSLLTPGLAALGVFLPFLAYGADSRSLLLRHPGDASALWQAVGGLAGLSASLLVLHAVVCIRLPKDDATEGSLDAGVMVYTLVLPPLAVGGCGAAGGVVLALVLRSALGIATGR